jgi:hypothetical protein
MEEHIPRVYETRVLRTFELKEDGIVEVRGKWTIRGS